MAMAAKEMKMEATPRMSMATRKTVFCFCFSTLIGSAGRFEPPPSAVM